jgi:hypothetical protein
MHSYKKGDFAGEIATAGRVQMSPDPLFNSPYAVEEVIN